MKQGSNRRLANVKTRTETGFEYVMAHLDLNTPFGKKLLKERKPFYPGEENELRHELDKVEDMMKFVRESDRQVSRIQETFMEMKDLSYTIRRSHRNALSVLELFEVKTMLLQMQKIEKLCAQTESPVPKEYVLDDVTPLLDRLDPRGDRLNTFYIYDDFSEKLAELRKEKHRYEILIRRTQKARKEEIRKEYGIVLTPKFDVIISRSSEDLEKARQIKDLEQISEDYMSVTFELTKSDKVYGLVRDMEEVNGEIEEEELRIRELLSQEVASCEELLIENCGKIGALDLALAKAIYGIRHDCVKPEIVEEHVVEFEEGRHLQVEEVLHSKGKEYCPVSIALTDGVTCITGANMGGKTISLKLSGLVPMLAQYGFFVPCRRARIGLSNYMQILIGDSQSVERGLSSFGSEMEELKEILDNSQDRSLILIDEIASGTNPIEGLALTRSLIDYLKVRSYISLITTHFDAVTEERDIKNMQVRGLADVDFRKLDSELHLANRRERINIISRYMDYRLYTVTENREIPKDALNIAKMLGLNEEIIEGAKKYIK
ncbi:MutS-related protein [Hornefia butyriciproducens]|uniref:lysine 5,6-aminomutase reactivase ATPase KamC n=1 Tax=Hornefia butyriciproducens TaxID=2652293 RepID=UPI002A9162F1|nr:hypothetical protein [Hornefia butyriciproducens]MCI7414016.1 DNA mismatch repair protein MutS [Clostridiales bacterium]MDY6210911.1 hypothetical protein [Hornefia butyriciproducens]